MSKVGEVLSLEYGAALPGSARSGQAFPVFGSSGVTGWHDQSLVKGPGIVVGRKGSVGCVSWSDSNFWPIDTTYFVVPKEGAHLRFLYYLLSWLPLRFLDSSTGVPGLNRSDVYALSFTKPSAQEQLQIADILDSLSSQIAETEALIDKLAYVKRGLLADLLTRGLDHNGQLRPPPERAPGVYQDTDIGPVPVGWDVAQLRYTVASAVLGTGARGNSERADPLRLIKMGNLDWNNTIKMQSTEFIGRDLVDPNLDLHDGDLLFNTRNTPELVGKTCSWRGPDQGYTFDNNIMRIRFNSKLRGHFAAFYMGSEIGRRRLGRLATGTTSVAAIYWKSLAAFTFPVPPAREQQQIVDIVFAHEAREAALREELDKLKRQKTGLMDDLLTGRVRVTPLLEAAQAVAE